MPPTSFQGRRSSRTFWDVTPCSLVDRYHHFGGSLKEEVVGTFKISVPICQTTRCHIAEDGNLESRCCENLNVTRLTVPLCSLHSVGNYADLD
jgi:hypothetical protein